MSFPGQDEAARTAGGQRPAALLHRGHPAQHRREPAVAAGTQKSLKPRETGADKKKANVTEKKSRLAMKPPFPHFFSVPAGSTSAFHGKKKMKKTEKNERNHHTISSNPSIRVRS